MNFNKYHVSKNLFDASVFSITYPDIISMSDTTIDVDLSNVSTSDRQALYNTGVPCAINAPFTISFKGVAKTNSATNGRLRLQFDDDSTDELYVTNNDGTPKDYSEGTFNKNLKAIKFNWSNYNSGFAFKELMINSSSEALPYEPYSSEVWHDIPHYIHNTSTDTLTTLPADIYANDTTATVGLKGDMSQTGTPSPTTPIQPQECGERTGNLFDKSTNIVAYYLTQITGVYSATSSTSRSALIPCEPSTTYTIHVPTNRTLRIVEFDHYPQVGDAGSNYTSQEIGSYIDKDVTVTTTATAKYLCVFCYNSAQEATQYTESEYFAQVMIIEGSTAPTSYIPYGYKIPILSANTTTPVYLGEVQSTRRIKKLVLTGEESSWYASSGFMFNDTIQPDYLRSTATTLICSHYKAIRGVAGGSDVSNGQCALYRFSSIQRLYIRDNNYTTVEGFKTYLAQQYAAGTPVTIWYVLAEPETAVVNEPLRKIGDYADTVSGITIPTITGKDSFDVLTTLKPSEVTVNYRGWHPVTDVHERENGAWT